MRTIPLGLMNARRLFTRTPGFALFAVATLALGIGASTLVFSLVRTALVRALPFAQPDTLVWMYNARTERERAPFSIGDFQDYRRQNTTLADLAVFTNWAANLTGAGQPERLEGTRVSGNFFQVLGARALMGRTLEPNDEAGGARAVMLTYGLWQRRFGGDAGIVGRDISLNGAAHTVVGVLPQGFVFPFREATLAVPTALSGDPRRLDRGANFLRVVARLGPGVTIERAKADLDAIARRLQRQYPTENSRKIGVNLYPLHAEIVRDYRQMLWALFAATLVFLAIACGNLANLMFVRSIARGPEFALRASLGASRARIIRELSVEALVIATIGGGAGAALAAFGLLLWRAAGPANFPRLDEVGLDPTVLAFAIGLSLLVATGCAAASARAAGFMRTEQSGSAGRRSTASRRDRAIQRAFVMLQVAGALVLLVCMTLVVRGFGELENVESGFTARNAVSMQLSLPPRTYKAPEDIGRFYDALRVRLGDVAGIRAAGVVSLRPLSGLLSTIDVAFPERPSPAPEDVPQAHFRIASAGYFAAAGIRVIDGREFADSDRAGTRPVAIVSRTFAARHWPGRSAVGQAVQIVETSASAPMEVVGVVADVKQFGLDGPATADLYMALPQMPGSQAALLAARTFWVLRTEADPRSLLNALPDLVHRVDPDVAASSIQTLDDIVDASLAGWRLDVRLLQAFGPLAVLLSMIGVYAVASFSASTRRRELAIRAALGATGWGLFTRTLREELLPVACGVATGVGVAMAAAPRLGALLFSASPYDPSAYVLACGALVAAALLATYGPARRAGKSDPGDLLRM